MKAAAICVVASLVVHACAVERHVTIELGPPDNTITSGFTCEDPMNPGGLLFQEAYDRASDRLSFNLVVDLIDVGAHVPSCLGEEVAKTCRGGTCRVTVADAATRFCQEVSIDHPSQTAALPNQIRDLLAANDPVVFSDAPHHPVIVRVVATTQPCSEIRLDDGVVWTSLAAGEVIGCAYSCPVDLDIVDGTLEVGLNYDARDLTPQQCVHAVQACAALAD